MAAKRRGLPLLLVFLMLAGALLTGLGLASAAANPLQLEVYLITSDGRRIQLHGLIPHSVAFSGDVSLKEVEINGRFRALEDLPDAAVYFFASVRTAGRWLFMKNWKSPSASAVEEKLKRGVTVLLGRQDLGNIAEGQEKSFSKRFDIRGILSKAAEAEPIERGEFQVEVTVQVRRKGSHGGAVPGRPYSDHQVAVAFVVNAEDVAVHEVGGGIPTPIVQVFWPGGLSTEMEARGYAARWGWQLAGITGNVSNCELARDYGVSITTTVPDEIRRQLPEKISGEPIRDENGNVIGARWWWIAWDPKTPTGATLIKATVAVAVGDDQQCRVWLYTQCDGIYGMLAEKAREYAKKQATWYDRGPMCDDYEVVRGDPSDRPWAHWLTIPGHAILGYGVAIVPLELLVGPLLFLGGLVGLLLVGRKRRKRKKK